MSKDSSEYLQPWTIVSDEELRRLRELRKLVETSVLKPASGIGRLYIHVQGHDVQIDLNTWRELCK